MYTIKTTDPRQWTRKKNPELSGCDCAECGSFIEYQTEAYFHKEIRGLVLCHKCKGGIKKYMNNPREYKGITYQSTLERNYAFATDMRKEAGMIKDWARQVKIPLNIKFVDGKPVLTDEPEVDLKRKGIKYIHIANYFMDFVITHNDGSLEYVETKGMELPVWQMKFILAEAILKDRVKLTVVKEQQFKSRKKNAATG